MKMLLPTCFLFGVLHLTPLVQAVGFPPLDDARVKQVFGWKQIDFKYASPKARAEAISSGEFNPSDVHVAGVHVAGNRVFLSMPRWKPKGIPATLAFVEYPSRDAAPPLTPYPDWASQKVGQCQGLTSVFRVTTDECGRLWVLDTGIASSIQHEYTRVCPAKVLTFDLKTDKLVNTFILKDEEAVRNESLPVNIKVEYPKGTCGSPKDAFLYIADTASFAIIVADLSSGQSWRIIQKTVLPDPEASTFHVGKKTFETMNGIMGMALSAPGKGDRTLYFSSMSSFKQHWVKTSVLRNKDSVLSPPRDEFKTGSLPRTSQTGAYAMDKNGVLFFGLLNSDALVCWNSRRNPYESRFFGVLAQDKVAMKFLAEVTIDETGRLWAISSGIQTYFSEKMNPNEISTRVFMSESTVTAVKGTICDNDEIKKKRAYKRDRTNEF
ncbi:protein yellow-like [Cloeon dipterum]|uniref:protein yellow-like n=1 Tax=Cloeon dipterum TaxID=197152 RepID=UPI0032203919